MNHQDVTVSNMQWCPPLIMVHQVGIDFPDSKGPTLAFVDPAMIHAIYKGVYRAKEGNGPGSVLECTVVQLKTRDVLNVTETTETVARLRDEAFGHKTRPSLTAVSEN